MWENQCQTFSGRVFTAIYLPVKIEVFRFFFELKDLKALIVSEMISSLTSSHIRCSSSFVSNEFDVSSFWD